MDLPVQQLWSSTRWSVHDQSQDRPGRGLWDCPSYIICKCHLTRHIYQQTDARDFGTSPLDLRAKLWKTHIQVLPVRLSMKREHCNLIWVIHCAKTSSCLHYTKSMSSIPQNTVFIPLCQISLVVSFPCQTVSSLRVNSVECTAQ